MAQEWTITLDVSSDDPATVDDLVSLIEHVAAYMVDNIEVDVR